MAHVGGSVLLSRGSSEVLVEEFKMDVDFELLNSLVISPMGVPAIRYLGSGRSVSLSRFFLLVHSLLLFLHGADTRVMMRTCF